MPAIWVYDCRMPMRAEIQGAFGRGVLDGMNTAVQAGAGSTLSMNGDPRSAPSRRLESREPHPGPSAWVKRDLLADAGALRRNPGPACHVLPACPPLPCCAAVLSPPVRLVLRARFAGQHPPTSRLHCLKTGPGPAGLTGRAKGQRQGARKGPYGSDHRRVAVCARGSDFGAAGLACARRAGDSPGNAPAPQGAAVLRRRPACRWAPPANSGRAGSEVAVTKRGYDRMSVLRVALGTARGKGGREGAGVSAAAGQAR